MITVVDDNGKKCLINEKYITALNSYTAANGEGKAIKVLLCHTGYIGLWYFKNEDADKVFDQLEKAMTKNGWRG